MNPPLRTPRDVEAVIEGLEDGTIDIIVTDHAPHSAEEKARGMAAAPFGIVGFETAFPLLYTKFVRTGKWTLGLPARQDDDGSGQRVRPAERHVESRRACGYYDRGS